MSIAHALNVLDGQDVTCRKKNCRKEECELFHAPTQILTYLAQRLNTHKNTLAVCPYPIAGKSNEICGFGNECAKVNVGDADHEARFDHQPKEFRYTKCVHGEACNMITKGVFCRYFHSSHETRAQHLNRVGFAPRYGHAFTVIANKIEYVVLYRGDWDTNMDYKYVMGNYAMCPYRVDKCFDQTCPLRHNDQFVLRAPRAAPVQAAASPKPAAAPVAIKPVRSSIVCANDRCAKKCGNAHTFDEYEPSICMCTEESCKKYHMGKSYMEWFIASINAATPDAPGENPWVCNRSAYLAQIIGTALSFVPLIGETNTRYVHRILKGSKLDEALQAKAKQELERQALLKQAAANMAAKEAFASNLSALKLAMTAIQAKPVGNYAAVVGGSDSVAEVDPDIESIGSGSAPVPNFSQADSEEAPAQSP